MFVKSCKYSNVAMFVIPLQISSVHKVGKHHLIVKVSYIARYPVRRTAQRALHVTPGRAGQTDTNSTSLGRRQSRNNYCVNTTCSHPPPCMARHSFIQLIELQYFGVGDVILPFDANDAPEAR